MPHSILLNEQTASEVIGLKVAILRKRRWQGLPPKFLKVGSKVFCKQEDLQKLLENCERLSTSDKGSHHGK